MAIYTKSQQRKKEESARLRGDGDQIRLFQLQFLKASSNYEGMYPKKIRYHCIFSHICSVFKHKPD